MSKQLSHYGLIGNCRSCALISDEGSIDFACLPNFDSQAPFCALLDNEKGGYFKIAPLGRYQTNQKYKDHTNILKTYFFNHLGSVSLTDFMPLTRSQNDLHQIPEYGPKFIRKIKARQGDHQIELALKLTPNFAQDDVSIEYNESHILFTDKNYTYILYTPINNIMIEDETIYIRFELKEGEEKFFAFGFYKNTDIDRGLHYTTTELRDLYRLTENFWLYWVNQCSYRGEYAEIVIRSALTLKLLTFNPTGAIVAAPTTSLPEKIGGSFNWDYRYTWLRDASFTVSTFLSLGYLREAQEFMEWMEQVCIKEGSTIKIMYRISGEEELIEHHLDHLQGYQHSQPIRIGNGAANQKQFDIFGEVLSTILLYVEAGGVLSEKMKQFVIQLTEHCSIHWGEKDAGIWESRNEYQHNTYSKLMCWVGLDCGIKIAQKRDLIADINSWRETKEKVKEDLLAKGYNHEIQSFVSYYDSQIVDTSTLNLALTGFLPAHDSRMLSTFGRIMKQLTVDWFVLRTDDDKNDLVQGEGTFFLCTFWFIDYLTMLGRIDEAKVWLNKIIHDGTPLGLYAEEFDPLTRQHLGNFPQAFTHLGLINTIINIQRKETAKAHHLQYKNPFLFHRFKDFMKTKKTPVGYS